MDSNQEMALLNFHVADITGRAQVGSGFKSPKSPGNLLNPANSRTPLHFTSLQTMLKSSARQSTHKRRWTAAVISYDTRFQRYGAKDTLYRNLRLFNRTADADHGRRFATVEYLALDRLMLDLFWAAAKGVKQHSEY